MLTIETLTIETRSDTFNFLPHDEKVKNYRNNRWNVLETVLLPQDIYGFGKRTVLQRRICEESN